MVVATFGRSEAIMPTLESIAAQTLRDFEVLVVADGVAEPGLAEVVERFDERFVLHETHARSGSQSGPNNFATALASGAYVAFLGHDDLWFPDHLADLAAAFEANPRADFAVGGCLFLGPPGAEDELTWVSGLFEGDDPAIAYEHFFPPSSLAHRRTLPAAVGPWPAPGERPMPVDSAFEVAAVEAGCRFVSTGRISTVKFISSARYLSYLTESDEEQREWLALSGHPEALTARVAERLEVARARGNVMNVRHPRWEGYDVRDSISYNQEGRGITVRTPEPLGTEPVWLPCGEEVRAFDWYLPTGPQGGRSRWSGPSPSPRLAVPLSHPEGAVVRIHLGPDSADVTTVEWDGVAVEHREGAGPYGRYVEVSGVLRERVSSVLRLHAEQVVDPTGSLPRRGVRLLGVEVVAGRDSDGAVCALAAAALDALRLGEQLVRAEEMVDVATGQAEENEDLRAQAAGLHEELKATRLYVDDLTSGIERDSELTQEHIRNLMAMLADRDARLAAAEEQVLRLRGRVRRLRGRLGER